HPTTAVAGVYAEMVRLWEGPPQTVISEEYAALEGNFGVRLEVSRAHPGLLALALPWFGARDHRPRMQRAAHVSATIVLTRDASGGRGPGRRDGPAAHADRPCVARVGHR